MNTGNIAESAWLLAEIPFSQRRQKVKREGGDPPVGFALLSNWWGYQEKECDSRKTAGTRTSFWACYLFECLGHPKGDTWEWYHTLVDGTESTKINTQGVDQIEKRERRDYIRNNPVGNQCQRAITARLGWGVPRSCLVYRNNVLDLRYPKNKELVEMGNVGSKSLRRKLSRKPEEEFPEESTQQHPHWQQIKSRKSWEVNVTLSTVTAWDYLFQNRVTCCQEAHDLLWRARRLWVTHLAF